jgi:hypothetical protein
MASISGTTGPVPMDVDAPVTTNKRPLEGGESSPSKAQKVASDALVAAPVFKSPVNWSAHMAQLHFGCTGLSQDLMEICEGFVEETNDWEKAHAESEKQFLLEVAKRNFMQLGDQKYKGSFEVACQDANWVYSVLEACRSFIEKDIDKNKGWEEHEDGIDVLKYPSRETIIKMLTPHSNNKKVVLLAIEIDEGLIHHASDELKNDEEIALRAVRRNGDYFAMLGDIQKDNPKVLFQTLQRETGIYICMVQMASERLQNDRSFFVRLFQSEKEFPNLELYNLEDSIRDDETIVFLAVTKHGKSIQYASERLRNDEQFITRLIEAGAFVPLSLAPEKYRDQEEFVRKTPDVINMSDRLKNDKVFILSLMECYKYSFLKLLLPHLRNDKDVVRQNFIHYGYIGGASEDLRKDRKFILSLIHEKEIKFKSSRYIYEDLISDFLDDEKIVLETLQVTGYFIASNRLQNNVNLVHQAILRNLDNFGYLSKDLRANPEIQTFVRKHYPNCIFKESDWFGITVSLPENPLPQ